MESAVRRARERAGVVTGPGPIEQDTQPVPVAALDDDPPTPPVPVWPGPQPPWSGPPGTPSRSSEPGRRDHLLHISVAVAAALVVIAGIALAVTSGGSGTPGAAPSTAASTGHAGTPTAQHPAARHHGRSRGSATTTSTAPAATPGGPPVIASLSPASGTAGQGIQIDGSNFLSPSGQIVASFNGQVTSTNCPAPNSCTVTVPPMNGSSSVQVTITTANGTSNAVTFTYS